MAVHGLPTGSSVVHPESTLQRMELVTVNTGQR